MNYIAKTERYETMKYNRCGKSGLFLPAMSLGLWQFRKYIGFYQLPGNAAGII